MSERVCATAGCGGEHLAKGLCVRCYAAKRRKRVPGPKRELVHVEHVVGVGLPAWMVEAIDRASGGRRSEWLRRAIKEKLLRQRITN